MVAILLAALLASPESLQSMPIDAACWRNLALRPFDQRRVLLLMFNVTDSETDVLIERLNRLSRRRDLLVLGISPDACRDVERYCEKKRIRFAVGAESKAPRRARVKLPALFLIQRAEGRSAWRDVRPDALDELLKRPPMSTPDWNADIPRQELIDLIDSDAEGQCRSDAVRKLAELMTPEEFSDFAAERLAEEPDPWVRGAFEFARRKLTGDPLPDDRMSESARLLREYNGQPDDPRWQTVRAFVDKHRTLSAAELAQAYAAHAGDAPQDVLIRRIAVNALWEATDRDTARRALLEAAARDPDESIRLFAVMGLSEVSTPGDQSTADLLEELARIEPNILRVRPMMQYVAFYLRTGNEDSLDMPVPEESP